GRDQFAALIKQWEAHIHVVRQHQRHRRVAQVLQDVVDKQSTLTETCPYASGEPHVFANTTVSRVRPCTHMTYSSPCHSPSAYTLRACRYDARPCRGSDWPASVDGQPAVVSPHVTMSPPGKPRSQPSPSGSYRAAATSPVDDRQHRGMPRN